LCQNFKAIGEELSEIVSGSTASSPDIDVPIYLKSPDIDVPIYLKSPDIDVPIYLNSPDIDVPIYLKTRAYLNSTLFQNLKAICEELSEFVSGSTASSPDIDVLYIYIYI
jgi:hypothetical protein